MREPVDTRRPPVVGAAEAAGILGVSRQGLWKIRSAHVETFPPATDLECGPVWYRDAVETWNREHRS
jgi:hypothetical protein